MPIYRSVRADQAWFWAADWQDREREADADLSAGRDTTFETADDFVEHLSRLDAAADEA